MIRVKRKRGHIEGTHDRPFDAGQKREHEYGPECQWARCDIASQGTQAVRSAMKDHPVLGALLFVMGVVLIAFAYSGSNPLPLLILGHIFAFNGVLWVALGLDKRLIYDRNHEQYQPKI